MEKRLGKIKSIDVGIQDSQLGLYITFAGKGWRVQHSVQFWDTFQAPHSEYCEWTLSDRTNAMEHIMVTISTILKQSKKSYISELQNIPVEITLKYKRIVGWRILEEVL